LNLTIFYRLSFQNHSTALFVTLSKAPFPTQKLESQP